MKSLGTNLEWLRAVRIGDDEAASFDRLLSGLGAALGADDEGRPIVRRWHQRLVVHREPLFGEAIADLAAMLSHLADRLSPETTAEWWRQGAPALSSEEALAGLARERVAQVQECLRLRKLVLAWLSTAAGSTNGALTTPADLDVIQEAVEHAELMIEESIEDVLSVAAGRPVRRPSHLGVDYDHGYAQGRKDACRVLLLGLRGREHVTSAETLQTEEER